MRNIFKDLKRRDHKRYLGGLEVLLTRETGRLILRQGLNLVIHCCGS